MRAVNLCRQALLVGATFTGVQVYYKPRFTFLPFQRIAYCDGKSQRPYLGCSLRSMNDSPGMVMMLVNTDSPAWHADLKVGDVLLSIDNQPVNKIADYYSAVEGKHGQKVEFVVERRGQKFSILV